MGKVKYFFLAVFLLTIAGVHAQYKPVLFGIRVAPNVAWMKSDQKDYSGDGIHPGFSWGFVGEFFLMENYALQTGFNVINISGTLSYPHAVNFQGDTVPTYGTMERRYRFRYLEIPLTFKMQVEVSEKSKLFAKIGLGMGFRLKATSDDTFTYEGESSEDERDITDDVRLIRSSLIVGGGYQYSFKGSTSLVVEIIYNDGFIDVLKGSNTADPSVDHSATCKFVELGVGIIF